MGNILREGEKGSGRVSVGLTISNLATIELEVSKLLRIFDPVLQRVFDAHVSSPFRLEFLDKNLPDFLTLFLAEVRVPKLQMGP